MKRIAIALLALLMLAACQPTPETDAVKQKDTNVLIDTVLSEQETTEADNPPAPVNAQFPERFSADFYTSANNVHVTVGAPIRVRSDGGFPLIRVERRAITNEERLALCRRLLKADTLYRFELRFDRDDLVRQISALMQEPTPEEKAEWMREDPENTEEAWNTIQEHRKEELARLQEQYRAMEDGETLPLAVWDGSLLPDDAENPGQDIVADPNVSNDIGPVDHASFTAAWHDRPITFIAANPDSTSNGSYDAAFFDKDNGEQEAYRIDPSAYAAPLDGARISPAEAANVALQSLEGFDSWAVSDIYWSNNATNGGNDAFVIHKRAYLVRLVPRFHGADLIWCGFMANTTGAETNAMPYWRYSHAIAAVDGSGTLLGLEWYGALKETEVLSETTPLLPFTEIQSIFEQQINRELAYEEMRDATLTVDDVQLGLFRIREQNDMKHGLLTPVWYFRGTLIPSETGVWAGHTQHYDRQPILIINAIDGTIIDPYAGY